MSFGKSQTKLSSIGFPRIGSLHTLGTTIDFVSIRIEIDRSIDAHSSSSLCTMHSSDRYKTINRTAVITGINEDGSLSATSSVISATNVIYMERSAQSLRTAPTSFLSSTFPLTDTVMNLIHIDDLVDSDGGVKRGKQQALHQRHDRLPHFRASWSAATVGYKSMADMVHCD